jgi:peptidoglycan/LPS O-acetylase OafA/YrhL
MGRENRNRWLELDALRALAVLLVVWSHCSNRNIGITGFDGVLLFFVISGFLITGILLEARASAPWPTVLRAFYARRFLRIFPVYYAVLFVAAGLGIPYVREALGWHLTFLSNWYYAYRGPLDKAGHLWSLALEEQFYLLWPWFALLLPAAALRWALGIMILTGPVSRLVLGSSGADATAVWTTTPAVLDALGLGCLLAYLWRQAGSADRWARWALVCGLLLIGCQAAAPKLGLATNPIFFLAVSTLGWRLLCFWLVHRAARGVPGLFGRLLVARPLIYVGTISYGIYLIHPFVMPAVLIAEQRFHLHVPIPKYPGLSQFLSVALISIAAASLSWKFFERPINSLKNRFPYVPSTRPVALLSSPSPDPALASHYRNSDL